MTTTDTDDHIDTRHWLGRGEPLITPERAAKGDLHIERCEGEQIRFAQLVASNVLNRLAALGVLTDQHVHKGGIYEVWKVCFSAELGYRNNPIYQPEMRGMRRMLSDEQLDVGDFEKLIRALTPNEKRVIEFCIFTPNTEHSIWLADRHVGAIRAAFDRMSEIMKRLKDEADTANPNHTPPDGLR